MVQASGVLDKVQLPVPLLFLPCEAGTCGRLPIQPCNNVLFLDAKSAFTTAQIAKANAATVEKAGFTATVTE